MKTRAIIPKFVLFCLPLLFGCNAENPVEDGSAREITFLPDGGTYANPVEVELSHRGGDEELYYTTSEIERYIDDYDFGYVTPFRWLTYYSNPIQVSSDMTITAYLLRDGDTIATAAKTYLIRKTNPIATPRFSPSSGSFIDPVTVSISSTEVFPGQRIYYQTDSSAFSPTRWLLYDKPFVVDSTRMIRAIAVADGRTNSAIATGYFYVRVDPPKVSCADCLDTAGGGYGGYSSFVFYRSQSISLTSRSANAAIYYTRDTLNRDFSTKTWTRYNAPISVSSPTSMRAVSVVDGRTSDARELNFRFCPLQPVIAPASGLIVDTQSIAITSATAGAVIHYTTDGSYPTTSSTRYTGPFRVSKRSTVRAISAKAGLSNSPVVEALFEPLPSWNTSIQYGSLTDSRDGRIYRTTKIGGQTWMAENLNHSGSSGSVGVCPGSGARNGSADSCTKFGRLYTLSEVMQNGKPSDANPSGVQGICPVGWHVPSDSEWQTLEVALGVSKTAAAVNGWRGVTVGGKLTSTVGWDTNVGTDAYGFRLLPAGDLNAGYFYNAGRWAYLWSSSLLDGKAEYPIIRYFTNGDMCRSTYTRTTSLSLRCVKN